MTLCVYHKFKFYFGFSTTFLLLYFTLRHLDKACLVWSTPHHSAARISETIWISSISYSCSHKCLCTAQNICPNFNYKIKLSAYNICRLIIWSRGCMHLHNMILIHFHTYMIYRLFFILMILSMQVSHSHHGSSFWK